VNTGHPQVDEDAEEEPGVTKERAHLRHSAKILPRTG
jgi:hypothetical protein